MDSFLVAVVSRLLRSLLMFVCCRAYGCNYSLTSVVKELGNTEQRKVLMTL